MGSKVSNSFVFFVTIFILVFGKSPNSIPNGTSTCDVGPSMSFILFSLTVLPTTENGHLSLLHIDLKSSKSFSLIARTYLS